MWKCPSVGTSPRTPTASVEIRLFGGLEVSTSPNAVGAAIPAGSTAIRVPMPCRGMSRKPSPSSSGSFAGGGVRSSSSREWEARPSAAPTSWSSWS